MAPLNNLALARLWSDVASLTPENSHLQISFLEKLCSLQNIKNPLKKKHLLEHYVCKGEAEHDIMYGKCIIVEGNGSGRSTERRIWFPRFPFSMMSHLIHLSPSVSLMRPWNIIVQPSNRFSHCYWPINTNMENWRPSTEGARVESGCLSNERVSGILIWVRQTSWIVMGERRCDVSKDSLSPLYLSWRVCFQVPNVFIAPCSRP